MIPKHYILNGEVVSVWDITGQGLWVSTKRGWIPLSTVEHLLLPYEP